LYRRAIPILRRSQGAADQFASAVFGLARTDVELGAPARARAALEPLIGSLDQRSDADRVAALFTLARALWDSGGDRRQAHALAVRANAEAAGAAELLPGEAARIERWLVSHTR
jgi:ATP/maltotriose-dependent transcriptional regulator MalT